MEKLDHYEENTGFQDRPMREVIESFLYTDDGMFGDIAFGAEQELLKRLEVPPQEWKTQQVLIRMLMKALWPVCPPPEWARKHPLPLEHPERKSSSYAKMRRRQREAVS